MESSTRLQIKGMVCDRCVQVVREELERSGLRPLEVNLGEVRIGTEGNRPDTQALQSRLAPLGLQLLEDREERLVRELKALVAEVYSGDYDFPEKFRFVSLVQARLGGDYDRISALFVAREKKTLERYLIEYRVQKIKEFLIYTNQTLADIAFRLNFSSVAHLSAQFKQVTGLTPSFFRENRRRTNEQENK